ncbi:uncharacterized protein LOC122723313 [Manihot esculenta]|uniref:uncharacterized protein LOC122723313 n=1 Tax=Manihot esculenta TaxID=3983 RepID=UPI001CC4BEAC|nr:uncharacterized protein LOC122723313 [Manihot esculenta]
MGQSKPLENLILPRGSLKVASKVLLVGRLMGRAIWQVVETVLPRSSGWPPPLVVVRAPKRLWAVEGSALTFPSFEKEISPMPLLSAFDINGGGENDQFIVPFGVEYLYYERLRSAALISLLKDEAYRWWTTLTQMVRLERQTWEFFLAEFKKKYIGALYIEERRREFLYLRQGRLTVTEYEREFGTLSFSRDSPQSGANKEEEQSRRQKGQQKRSQSQYQGQSSASQTSSKRQREFQQTGQRGPPRQIQRPGQSSVVRSGQQTTSVSSTGGPGRGLPPVCEHCGRRHGGVCRRLTGACYLCGSSDHFMRDCPRGQSVQPIQTERSLPTGSRGRGRGRGESSSAQSHRVSETVDRPDTRAPARAYAIRAREDQDKPDVIAGEGTSKGKEIARD